MRESCFGDVSHRTLSLVPRAFIHALLQCCVEVSVPQQYFPGLHLMATSGLVNSVVPERGNGLFGERSLIRADACALPESCVGQCWSLGLLLAK